MASASPAHRPRRTAAVVSRNASGPRPGRMSTVATLAAALQMASTVGRVGENLDRADALLDRARRAGAELAVLPEMFNTGYGLIPDYAPLAEPRTGRTLSHLSARARKWKL